MAALFALHPLHVESVAWVSERKDVLSTFFWLLTMWAYVWYTESPGVGRYLAVLVCFILGLMSKPMLVTLPFVLLLLDYWPLGRWPLNGSAGAAPAKKRARQTNQRVPLHRLILEKVPLLVVAALCGIVALYAQKEFGVVESLAKFPFTSRLINVLVAYVSYMAKMIWPTHLAIYYPLVNSDITLGRGLGAGLILLFLSLVRIWQARRRPYLLVGWLWYLVTLVPVIGLVQVGTQALADRYTYVPLIGLFLMVAFGLRDLTAGWRGVKALAPLGAGILLVALAICTYWQVDYWHDAQSLYEHALRITKNNSLIHNNLGTILHMQGKAEAAISHYNEALRIQPESAFTHFNLGLALDSQGKMEQAILHYREAIHLKPDNALFLKKLAYVLATTADPKFRDAPAAVQLAEKANRLTRFSQPEMIDTLAAAYAAAGRFPEAIQASRKALDLARRSGKSDLAKEIEARMRFYQKGLPHHAGPEGSTLGKESSR